MPDSRPEQLIHAEELIYNGKVEEAFEIVVNFEKKDELTQKDLISALLLKGWIFYLTHQVTETIEVGELTYSMSQDLGLVPESIEALILKSLMVYTGEINEAFNLILRAERLLNSLSSESPSNITKLIFHLTILKIAYYFLKGDLNRALNLAMDAVLLGEKIKNYAMIGQCLRFISLIYSVIGNLDASLEYAMKGLTLYEKLDFQFGISAFFYSLGIIDFYKGDLNRALEICDKGLSREKINDYDKVNLLNLLGRIHQEKGELNKALKITKKSIKLAEETKNYVYIPINSRCLGQIYRRKGEIDQAIKYFEQTLLFSDKIGTIYIVPSLVYLLLINIDIGSHEEAQKYLTRLEDLSDQHKNTLFKHEYPLGKALMLKMSTRMRDKVKAEEILKQIIEDDIVFPQFHILSIVSLCDLLLEELSIYNDPKIIEEIKPLIEQLFEIADSRHSKLYLAEVKFLQAKLALIQMEIEGAKKSLTEAQKIAEAQGLSLLAQKISSEYDILLEKVGEWEKLNNDDAPMVERIKLASVDGVLNRLQGKSAVDPPELVDEEPILLLIMDDSGATYFNHTFMTNWDHSDLFGLFMSALNNISDEIFSKSIDRIRIDENTILVQPVEPFLACYVIRGQSYPALQKLTRFTEAIRQNSEIWEALNKSTITSEIVELSKSPGLKTVIDEIFT